MTQTCRITACCASPCQRLATRAVPTLLVAARCSRAPRRHLVELGMAVLLVTATTNCAVVTDATRQRAGANGTLLWCGAVRHDATRCDAFFLLLC